MHSLQPSGTPRSRTGRAWPRACGRVVGWSGSVVAGPPSRVAALAVVSQCPTRLCAHRPSVGAPRSSSRAPACAPHVVSWLSWPCRGPVSRHSPAAYCPLVTIQLLYCDIIFLPAQYCLLQFTAVYCNTKPSPSSSSQSQYTRCIAIQIPLANLSCNTLLASLGHVKIQILLSQYNLGSSPSEFLLQFFFIFHYFFFFSIVPIISSNWKNHLKLLLLLLLLLLLFIFLNTQINL